MTYEYAKGVLIQHKPWSKDKTLTKLLKDRNKTIHTFKRMMDRKQFPTCVRNQYILAMKYSHQRKLKFLNSKSVEQPYNLVDMNEEDQASYSAHQHGSHFSDNKHHNKVIDGMSVDIGTGFDWSESGYEEKCDLSCDGTRWVDKICEENDRAVKGQASAVDNLVIPTQRDGEAYDVENMSNEQQKKCLCSCRHRH